VTPERWERVKALFTDASARAPAQRLEFVNSVAGNDAELRDEVLSLLRASEGGDSLPAARAAIAALVAEHHDVLTPLADVADRHAELRATLESALGQQYEIVSSIGHGSMGVVYLARERALERFVAIKVLRPELALAQEGRERFRREARVAAQLSHPGILPLHTFGEVGGIWYFVMGYVRGTTLAERLRIEGRVPIGDAQRIFAELTDAIDCAHRSGVIHRDIKPANILIDAESGRAVLADFGIAKIESADDQLTASGMIIGTPSYMSPEQATGEDDVDARSDLYSLGAVAYRMLSGREAVTLVTGGGAFARRAMRAPPDLRSVAPEVPPPLAAIVMRCLARDPNDRWASARSLRDALGLADDEPSHGSPALAHELPAFGPYALLWATLWVTLAASPFRSIGDRALLVLIALIVPAGLVLHVWNVAGGGLPPSQIARVAFWPPEWWGMWWPRRLRRPSDLWRRLPWPARLVRSALSAFVIALPALILTRQWTEAVTGAGVGWFGATETALVSAAAAIVLLALSWAHRRGLEWPDTVRLLFGATIMSAGWDAPPLRRLLAPVHGGVRPPEPREPADYVRAIEEVATRLNGSVRESASRAAEVTHRLVDFIDDCDAELNSVSKAGGAGGTDRVAEQIAALESTVRRDNEMAELLRLLRAQLEVVERMRVRAEVLSSRRARLLQFMHGVWTRVAALQDVEPDGVREAIARLDVVLEEIEAGLSS
jgi:hypothetical protein